MSFVQSLIDRQLGIFHRINYDSILERLVVKSEDSFYGLQNTLTPDNFDQDPPIFACRFAEASGYEHILALANEDGRVAIQNTSSAATASTIEGFQCHNNAVFDLIWRPGYMNFVTVSGDHTAALWDVGEGSPRRVLTFAGHTRSVKTAAFRPDDPSVFATGARDGQILVWDVRAPPAPPAAQRPLVLRPDNWLRNCHPSPAPPAAPKRARPDARRAGSVTSLAFRDGTALASCGECDGNIKVWDLRKSYSAYRREPLPQLAIPYCGGSARNGYTSLVVDDARLRLYASCMDGVVYCFNLAAGGAPPERRFVGHESGTFYIKAALSPDGRHLASGSSDRHAYVWNVRSGAPVARLAAHRAEVTCVAWARHRPPALVTCGDDARHMIWRLGPERDLALHGVGDSADDVVGRVEPVERGVAWPACALRTPPSLKRRAAPESPASGGKRARLPPRKSKRCLTELQGTAGAEDPPSKRPRECTPPPTPLEASPGPAQSLTADLPDFVADGTAPHLRLMSPARPRCSAPDWLTALRSRRVEGDSSAKRATPPADRSPRTPPAKRVRTLLSYFSPPPDPVGSRGGRT